MNFGNDGQQWFDQAGLLAVEQLRSVLVVAPHADDESLGCGGTIALLRQAGLPVQVVLVSDGTMSHPNSRKYNAEQRMLLREKELVDALHILGVEKEAIHFMRLKDSEVPHQKTVGFDEATALFLDILQQVKPATVLVPWRRDPHQDHRGTWQLVNAALFAYTQPVRRLEYLIWLWERGTASEAPQEGEARLWKVAVKGVQSQKQAAIRAHASQVTRLIDDDPEGFILSPEVLAHFNRPYELFAEAI
jgi:LmbE family N-acetylglucosaminyl deacetylase